MRIASEAPGPVVAVVVLFHPNEPAFDNIDALVPQVEMTVVVDNTPVPSLATQAKFQGRTGIHYLPQLSNRGVAAALNLGASVAISRGAEYLLTMDQDSRPSEGMVDALHNWADAHPAYSAVGPLHVDPEVEIPVPGAHVEERETIMTSGSLIRLIAYRQAGGFYEDLFIDGVDDEFCLRTRTFGWRVARLNSIRLVHSLGKMSARKWFGRTVHPTHHAPERYYFQVRNHVILRKMYFGRFPAFLRWDRRRHFGRLVKMLCYEKQRIVKFREVLRGYRDGLRWDLTRAPQLGSDRVDRT